MTLTGSTLNVARPRDASLPAKLEYGLRGREHAYCIYIAYCIDIVFEADYIAVA